LKRALKNFLELFDYTDLKRSLNEFLFTPLESSVIFGEDNSVKTLIPHGKEGKTTSFLIGFTSSGFLICVIRAF
jgi:hypothetical protein